MIPLFLLDEIPFRWITIARKVSRGERNRWQEIDGTVCTVDEAAMLRDAGLAFTAHARDEHGCEVLQVRRAKQPVPKPPSAALGDRTYKDRHVGVEWTPTMDKRLLDAAKTGKTHAAMAEMFGVSRQSVSKRLGQIRPR